MFLKDQTYIIAEAGINHNGDFNKAINLIKEAKKCGANAIKFQSFRAEDVVTKNLKLAQYQKKKRTLLAVMQIKFQLTC